MSKQTSPRRGAPLLMLDLNTLANTEEQTNLADQSPSTLRAIQSVAKFKALWLSTQNHDHNNKQCLKHTPQPRDFNHPIQYRQPFNFKNPNK
jgi:hypothetical protein